MLLLAFLAVAAGSFALGIAASVLCLSAKQDDLLYEQAKKTWRRMDTL